MSKKTNKLTELKDLYDSLLKYHTYLTKLMREGELDENEKQAAATLLLEIGRKVGYVGKLIAELTRLEKVDVHGKEYDMWVVALRIPPDKLAHSALGYCIQVTNRAIGRLEDDIEKGYRDKEGKVLKKPHEIATEPPKDAADLPSYLFDRMQFHPRVIRVSESLFKTGNYAQAIFEAFKAVDNFVKEKTALTLDGQALMSKVFDENEPIIKLNDLLTRSDRDEQEGFKFMFKGATIGIRNPKAHGNVIQTDPYRTLEYLSFASLLMRRIEEGKVVRLGKHV